MIAVVMRHELTRLRRSPSSWVFAAIFTLLIGLAVASGARWRDRIEGERVVARADLEASKADLSTAMSTQSEPWASPWMSMAWLPTRAELPLLPLAPVAIDRIERHDLAAVVAVDAPEPHDGEDLFASPLALQIGRFDLATVIVVLLPLGLIAVGYDLFVGERVRGTLALVRVTVPHANDWVLGVLSARCLAFVAPIVVLVLVGALVLGAELDLRLAGLVLVVALYGVFWVALAGWIGARAASASWAVTANVASWTLLVVVLPGLVALLADLANPLPSQVALRIELDRTALDSERDGPALLATHVDDHPELASSNADEDPRGWAKRLALVMQAETERRAPVLASVHEREVRMRTMTSGGALFSPATATRQLLLWLAGHDEGRLTQYHEAINQLRASRRAALIDLVVADRPFDIDDTRLLSTQLPGITQARSEALGLVLLLFAQVVLVGWAALRRASWGLTSW